MEDHLLIDNSFITNSSIASYLRCNREYKLTYVDALDPYYHLLEYDDSDNMKTGSCIHKALHLIHQDKDYETALLPYKNIDFSHSNITMNAKALIEARLRLEDEDIISKYNYIEKEIDLIMEHNDEKYRAKIDGIIDDIDGLWVVDHKTSQYSASYFNHYNSRQGLLYCMIAIHHGFDVKGYIIDGWRFLHRNIRTKKNIETPNEFIGWGIEDIITTTKGHYKAKLSDDEDDIYKGKLPYFSELRYEVSREELIKEFNNIVEIAKRIRTDSIYPRNSDACYMYGSKCKWWNICHQDVKINDVPTLPTGHSQYE